MDDNNAGAEIEYGWIRLMNNNEVCIFQRIHGNGKYIFVDIDELIQKLIDLRAQGKDRVSFT